MKFNTFMSVIAALIAALISYYVFYLTREEPLALLYTVGTFVCFTVTLVPMLALKHPDTRIAVNLRVFTAIFLVLFLGTTFLFAYIAPAAPLYVCVNGILVLAEVGGLYKLSKVKTA